MDSILVCAHNHSLVWLNRAVKPFATLAKGFNRDVATIQIHPQLQVDRSRRIRTAFAVWWRVEGQLIFPGHFLLYCSALFSVHDRASVSAQRKDSGSLFGKYEVPIAIPEILFFSTALASIVSSWPAQIYDASKPLHAIHFLFELMRAFHDVGHVLGCQGGWSVATLTPMRFWSCTFRTSWWGERVDGYVGSRISWMVYRFPDNFQQITCIKAVAHGAQNLGFILQIHSLSAPFSLHFCLWHVSSIMLFRLSWK